MSEGDKIMRATAEVPNPHPHRGRNGWEYEDTLATTGELFIIETDGTLRRRYGSYGYIRKRDFTEPEPTPDERGPDTYFFKAQMRSWRKDKANCEHTNAKYAAMMEALVPATPEEIEAVDHAADVREARAWVGRAMGDIEHAIGRLRDRRRWGDELPLLPDVGDEIEALEKIKARLIEKREAIGRVPPTTDGSGWIRCLECGARFDSGIWPGHVCGVPR